MKKPYPKRRKRGGAMNRELDSLSYVIELIEGRITQQQNDVDEWLCRVNFYEGEGWDDIAEQAGRILQRTMSELERLRRHRDQLQAIKGHYIKINE